MSVQTSNVPQNSLTNFNQKMNIIRTTTSKFQSTTKITPKIFKRCFFKADHLAPIDSFRETMSSISSQGKSIKFNSTNQPSSNPTFQSTSQTQPHIHIHIPMILTAAFQGVPNPSKYHGMTLSSVTSLTINPEPIIQFNLQVPSTTSSSLHKNKYFALHIMKPTIDSVKLARNFSRGIKVSKDPITGKVKTTRPFEGLNVQEYDLYLNGEPLPLSLDADHKNDVMSDDISLNLPILCKNAERIMICEKYKVFRVYNHEIWTAKVKDILVNVEPSDKTGGLLYFNRQFHSVGVPLKKEDIEAADVVKKDGVKEEKDEKPVETGK
ncbi:unnamed protein product [Ambrosiozyma monospora]|uniref:Unnamed protein product n=1 Tax=Ambrosiozyma monospora TaxID=43982 RepID=A0A9W6YUD9_AMBMO|nr:unnamed protein product [Ambrosiozyma monospora]